MSFQSYTLTFQFLSTKRFGDFRSRWTIVGVLVCKQFMPLACKLENFKMWKFIDVNDGWKGMSVIISYHIQSHFYSSFLINLIIRAMKNSVQVYPWVPCTCWSSVILSVQAATIRMIQHIRFIGQRSIYTKPWRSQTYNF